MKTYFVKELSRVTNVSIRTLHYYDKIGLLKPSDRLPNGYRVYAEKDLHKLEKIIVLKFFGFTLARIKQLLSNEQETLSLLQSQLRILQSEVSFQQEAQRNLLLASINEYKSKARIDWHHVVSLIGEFAEASKALSFQSSKITSVSETSNESSYDGSQFQDLWQCLITKIQNYNSENTP